MVPPSSSQFLLPRSSVRQVRAAQARSLSRLFLYLFVCVCFSTACLSQALPRSEADGISDPALEARVNAILQKMTLEEKIGQLVQYSAGQPTGPGTGRSDYEDMIAKGQIGSLFNVIEPHQINMYQRIAMEKSRLHIPILFGLDVIHGFKTEFPIPLGLASTWDPAIVEKASRVAAMEAAADGIRWTFSPMVDIARDARWGRMAEGAGEDPYLGSAMAAAYVRGYQGARLDAPGSIASCAKHFVGYGAAEAGRDYNTTEISEHTLREFYLPPFHAAVEAGTASLMSAFNTLNGTPSSANPFTLRQVLRREWGFQGLVVSDWNAVGELIPHGLAIDGATAARKAFLAGVDMDMVSSLYHDHLQALVSSRQIPAAAVDEAVRHVLRVKLALGLFEHPFVDEAAAPKALYHPESIALSQTAAERSFVLLKNGSAGDGQPLLPLAKGTQNFALIGPLAEDSSYPDGAPPGSGPRTTLLAALVQRAGQEHVTRYKGTGILEGSDQDLADAVAGARKSDIVILALGESPDMSGEAASRAHLGLPGRQQELLEAVVRTGKPVILILFSGRPLTVPWAFEHVPAVVAAWLPGMSGGPALVRTLFGDVNPSGKLVVSWPRSVGQEPLYYNAMNTGRPAETTDLTHAPGNIQDRYVSRYIDEQNSPQFPFGYGLSYTTFSYGPTKVSSDHLNATELNRDLGGNRHAVLSAEAQVSNTGSRAANEIVQLYVRIQGASTEQPVRALKGFQTVSLAPGESKEVKFDLPAESFAVWNDRNQFAAEPSKLTIWIAPDSAHGTPAQAQIVP
ncbi:MAG TPA: glycoside hydrolase family 3 N-terminal domain-containing protein [Candidatus Sulfotelmatobacter sp.]|nr:glycoside hydrolase family 3 N-terminal domain-containing protein [Candidatus Sulfotelmatobacter sp.]